MTKTRDKQTRDNATSVAVVRIRRLPDALDLPLPSQATPDSAGFDLRAHVADDIELAPGARELIPTGIAIALPSGYEAQIRPRSGLAVKQGISLVNTPGTIDADYRGEIKVILINLGQQRVTIHRGDRIAQLVVQRLPTVRFEEVAELSETDRGAGGFGHSGRA